MIDVSYPKERYPRNAPHPWMDRDWLYDQYVTKDYSTQEIADAYGCKRNTIQCWLKKHGIKKDEIKRVIKPKHQYHTYDYLYQQHIILHKSIAEIARENNVSGDTIKHNMQKFNIDIWHVHPQSSYTKEDEDRMIDMYCNQKMSALQIGQEFGASHGTIIKHLKSRGIEIRDMSETQFAINGRDIPNELSDRDWLQQKHWVDNISCKDIAEMLGVDPGCVRRKMHSLGLKTKSVSESKTGVMVGEKHHNWKGGITPARTLLREYFHINQAPNIMARDNYTCQLCGAKHVALHVHHIRHFTDIVDEIFAEHADLDPADPADMQVLYNIVTHDKRFLDEDNLITYCRDCHLFKIHGYKRKTISSQASDTEEGSETILPEEYDVSA